jgi:hypothetical protein
MKVIANSYLQSRYTLVFHDVLDWVRMLAVALRATVRENSPLSKGHRRAATPFDNGEFFKPLFGKGTFVEFSCRCGATFNEMFRRRRSRSLFFGKVQPEHEDEHDDDDDFLRRRTHVPKQVYRTASIYPGGCSW